MEPRQRGVQQLRDAAGAQHVRLPRAGAQAAVEGKLAQRVGRALAARRLLPHLFRRSMHRSLAHVRLCMHLPCAAGSPGPCRPSLAGRPCKGACSAHQRPGINLNSTHPGTLHCILCHSFSIQQSMTCTLLQRMHATCRSPVHDGQPITPIGVLKACVGEVSGSCKDSCILQSKLTKSRAPGGSAGRPRRRAPPPGRCCPSRARCAA